MGHRGTSEKHILQAIELLSRKVISLKDVPHRLISLAQLPEVVKEILCSATRRNSQFVKAIVDFSREDRGDPIIDC